MAYNVAAYPGVMGDGDDPAGLLVDGGILVNRDPSQGELTTFGGEVDGFPWIIHQQKTGAGEFRLYRDGGLEQTILDNTNFALATLIAGPDAVAPNTPYTGQVYYIQKLFGSGGYVWQVLDTGTMLTQGGLGLAITTKTGDYPATDADSTIVVDASSKTITLPSAVTAGAGRIYVVVNGPSGATTTVASAAGTINGASTDTTLTSAYNRATFQSDGTNWIRIG